MDIQKIRYKIFKYNAKYKTNNKICYKNKLKYYENMLNILSGGQIIHGDSNKISGLFASFDNFFNYDEIYEKDKNYYSNTDLSDLYSENITNREKKLVYDVWENIFPRSDKSHIEILYKHKIYEEYSNILFKNKVKNIIYNLTYYNDGNVTLNELTMIQFSKKNPTYKIKKNKMYEFGLNKNSVDYIGYKFYDGTESLSMDQIPKIFKVKKIKRIEMYWYDDKKIDVNSKMYKEYELDKIILKERDTDFKYFLCKFDNIDVFFNDYLKGSYAIPCCIIIPWKNKMVVYMYEIGYFVARGTTILSNVSSEEYLIQCGDLSTTCFISNTGDIFVHQDGDTSSLAIITTNDKKKPNKLKKARPSPSESATLFDVGTIKKGNDGNNYIIIKNKNGVQRWVIIK